MENLIAVDIERFETLVKEEAKLEMAKQLFTSIVNSRELYMSDAEKQLCLLLSIPLTSDKEEENARKI